jgi:hypothetical protein
MATPETWFPVCKGYDGFGFILFLTAQILYRMTLGYLGTIEGYLGSYVFAYDHPRRMFSLEDQG